MRAQRKSHISPSPNLEVKKASLITSSQHGVAALLQTPCVEFTQLSIPHRIRMYDVAVVFWYMLVCGNIRRERRNCRILRRKYCWQKPSQVYDRQFITPIWEQCAACALARGKQIDKSPTTGCRPVMIYSCLQWKRGVIIDHYPGPCWCQT